MLTVAEYEEYQKKMKELEVKISVLEEKQKQLQERLRNEFGMTVEEADAKVKELQRILPEKEAEWEKKFEEFKEKCSQLEQN